MSERELYRIEVPEIDRQSAYNDIPNEYRVVVPDESHGIPCLINGLYGSDWWPNCSPRWLVRHLIDKLTDIIADLPNLHKRRCWICKKVHWYATDKKPICPTCGSMDTRRIEG